MFSIDLNVLREERELGYCILRRFDKANKSGTKLFTADGSNQIQNKEQACPVAAKIKIYNIKAV